jgi:hypothetical protein
VTYQVWDEEGYITSYTDEDMAKRRADRDHAQHNSYAVVHKSDSPHRRPDESTIVYRAEVSK